MQTNTNSSSYNTFEQNIGPCPFISQFLQTTQPIKAATDLRSQLDISMFMSVVMAMQQSHKNILSILNQRSFQNQNQEQEHKLIGQKIKAYCNKNMLLFSKAITCRQVMIMDLLSKRQTNQKVQKQLRQVIFSNRMLIKNLRAKLSQIKNKISQKQNNQMNNLQGPRLLDVGSIARLKGIEKLQRLWSGLRAEMDVYKIEFQRLK